MIDKFLYYMVDINWRIAIVLLRNSISLFNVNHIKPYPKYKTILSKILRFVGDIFWNMALKIQKFRLKHTKES